MSYPNKVINIGLVGAGTVGSGVIKILLSQRAEIEKKTGVRLVLKKVCVRRVDKKRSIRISKTILTNNYNDILKDPSIHIVVEVMGGIHPAGEIIESALRQGKHVVTANKALLAENGKRIFALARERRMRLGIEASVCGGIPIIKAVKEGLASNHITSLLGIVNGTCNYILTSMSDKGVAFNEALHEAQKMGYAEKNPRLDIDGIDSAHKLAILARLSFGSEIPFKKIYVEGIRGFSIEDIQYAKELGYIIRLLAIGKKVGKNIELRVHPTMLPLEHPLASVRGVYNAVFVHGDQVGDQLFYGRGAGMMPTASAVMSDVIDISKRITGEVDLKSPMPGEPLESKILPMEQISSNYYLRFRVVDKPGVLGRIARTLGDNQISILSVHQKETQESNYVSVIILTYEALEKNVRKALKTIDSSSDVKKSTIVMRVEK